MTTAETPTSTEPKVCGQAFAGLASLGLLAFAAYWDFSRPLERSL